MKRESAMIQALNEGLYQREFHRRIRMLSAMGDYMLFGPRPARGRKFEGNKHNQRKEWR